MASPIPIFKTLIRVDEFRDLVLNHFRKEINDGELYDPRDVQRFKDIDEYATMFLQHGQFATEFDQDRALRIFNASMSWRKKNNVYDVSPNDFPRNYFDRNAIFFKNHDTNNNPLLHFVVRTFVKGQEDNEAVKRFITYNFERHVRRYPGQRIVILFDMSDTGLKHLDYDLVKFIISSAQIYYPGLLGYMLIFKLPFILTAAWKIIRGWLPTEAEQFIKFVDVKDIGQYIRSDQLSVSMGGTDTTRYVHPNDPAHEAVEDPMNASIKKKVTFADAGSADFQSTSSPTELVPIIDLPIRHDTSTFNPDTTTYEELNHSVASAHNESSQYIPRKSILQKSIHTNGNSGEEKVFHGLAIRPFDELIFERADQTASSTTDSIQTLILTNAGDKMLTFKIKTTSPEKFRVKPGCSLLHPGASATVSVYLLKAHCSPSSVINKEKFLIIWTLIGQEMKQPQLTEFWKTVPSSVLYEHRLKCSFATKSPSQHTSIPNPSVENSPHSRSVHPPDSSLIELQKLVKDSIAIQQTTQQQMTNQLKQIQRYFLILFLVIFLIFLWDIFKTSFSFRSTSSPTINSDL